MTGSRIMGATAEECKSSYRTVSRTIARAKTILASLVFDDD
jgi:hypothetical protein